MPSTLVELISSTVIGAGTIWVSTGDLIGSQWLRLVKTQNKQHSLSKEGMVLVLIQYEDILML